MDSTQLKAYFNFNQGDNPDDDTATILGIEGRSYSTKIYYLQGCILVVLTQKYSLNKYMMSIIIYFRTNSKLCR